jgi:hypothetical protein
VQAKWLPKHLTNLKSLSVWIWKTWKLGTVQNEWHSVVHNSHIQLSSSDQASTLSNYDDQWKWDYLAWPWRQYIVLSSHAPKYLSFRLSMTHYTGMSNIIARAWIQALVESQVYLKKRMKKSMGSFKGWHWQRPSFYQSFKLDSKPF